jgi:hypothetical protein
MKGLRFNAKAEYSEPCGSFVGRGATYLQILNRLPYGFPQSNSCGGPPTMLKPVHRYPGLSFRAPWSRTFCPWVSSADGRLE